MPFGFYNFRVHFDSSLASLRTSLERLGFADGYILTAKATEVTLAMETIQFDTISVIVSE